MELKTSETKRNKDSRVIALFWGITIILPVLILALIEGGLRIGGYNADSQELFIEAPNNSNFLITNGSFSKRYFPLFKPKVAPNAIRKKKGGNTFRVVVLGGSSAQGFPYNFYYSFAEQLEQMLLINTHGVNVEVINLGMTAVNSYVIHDLAKRIADLDVDAVVIYAGHNEYYGSFGAASTQFGLVNNVGLKRFILFLKDFRLYQLMEEMMKPDAPKNVEQRTLMAKVVSESDIAFEGEIYEDGIEQFEKNMGDVLKRFSKKSIPVYFCTIASNLKDQKPMEDNEAAVDAFELASEKYEQGDLAGARQHFIEAKELDGIRFRAPEMINEKVKELAQQYGATVVDAQKVLEEHSASGIEDASLFVDHLHPTSEGHRLIAETVMQELLKLNPLKQAYAPNGFAIPQQTSTFEDAYSYITVARLLVGYPFVKGLTVEQELKDFQKIYDGYLQSTYVDSLAAFTARNALEVPQRLTDVINHGKQTNDSLLVMSHYYELIKWQLNSTELIEKGIEYSVDNRATDVYLVNMLLHILNDGASDTRYMNVLSAVYLLNGYGEQAKYWMDKSEKMGSTDPMLYYNLTRYHILKEDIPKAEYYYSKYMQLSGKQQ